jgi:hypothetical protein
MVLAIPGGRGLLPSFRNPRSYPVPPNIRGPIPRWSHCPRTNPVCSCTVEDALRAMGQAYARLWTPDLRCDSWAKLISASSASSNPTPALTHHQTVSNQSLCRLFCT